MNHPAHLASVPVPDLLGVARANAWKNFGLSLAAILLGAVVAAVGAVVFLFIPVGIIMIIAGLIMAPISLWRALDPTGHETVRPLGRTPEERKHALKVIEWELGHPSTWQIKLTSGTLAVTASWLVHYSGSSVMLMARNDLVWYWETVERGRYGSSSHYLTMHSRRASDPVKIAMQAGPDHHVWAALHHACPFAFCGYGPALQQMPVHAIAAEVDRRAYHAHHEARRDAAAAAPRHDQREQVPTAHRAATAYGVHHAN